MRYKESSNSRQKVERRFLGAEGGGMETGSVLQAEEFCTLVVQHVNGY
jgi:hypothetical protein